MKKILTLALIAGMFMPLMTGAQEKKGKSPDEQFATLDADKNGKLTKDEFLARTADDKKENRGKAFDRWDKDGDKSLTLEEFKAGLAMAKKKN